MQAEISRVDVHDTLHLRFGEAPPALVGESEPALALRSRGDHTETVRVRRVQREGGHVRADLSELPLADGVWDVLLLDTEGKARPVTTADSCFSLAERAAYIEVPRQRELRVQRGATGQLRLRSAQARPYAQIEWVEVGDTHVTVSGVPAYLPQRSGRQEAHIVARQRKRPGVVTADAEFVDSTFHCRIPLRPMVDAHDFQRKHNEWDLWLSVAYAGVELRLASHADDVNGKKERVSFPGAVLDAEAGRHVRVNPYYTVYDGLSLLARAVAGGKGGKR
ncbi:hypothetical protein [Salinactinospora qingdaonensis]|uniref:Uncharacterized protein n=1 Tax=Salinactinospora qingdaonensis TaxID=702744 RepID=A0ABP7FZU8_9ACTN